jgi:hypothetical protein
MPSSFNQAAYAAWFCDGDKVGATTETDRFRRLDIVRGATILGVIWQYTYFDMFAGKGSAIFLAGPLSVRVQ